MVVDGYQAYSNKNTNGNVFLSEECYQKKECICCLWQDMKRESAFPAHSRESVPDWFIQKKIFEIFLPLKWFVSIYFRDCFYFLQLVEAVSDTFTRKSRVIALFFRRPIEISWISSFFSFPVICSYWLFWAIHKNFLAMFVAMKRLFTSPW